MILKMIWRNLWRNKRRTLITMASVFFAVLIAILLKSLQEGFLDNLVKDVVSFYSGYIQVHKKGYWDEQVLDNSFDYSDSIRERISENKHIRVVAPRIESFALVSSDRNTRGCMVVGTIPSKEQLLTQLGDKVVEGKYFQDNEKLALVAEGLAQQLNLKVNDTVVLIGQGYHGNSAAGKYAIKGIVRFGSPQLNDGLVYLPLQQAQEFFGAENRVTSAAVLIDHLPNLNSVKTDLQKDTGPDYEVMTWKEMMPELENFIEAKYAGTYLFTGILYFIIAFGIGGTVLMLVAERKYEFGMLLAIGMKKIRIALMLLGEMVLISLSGALIAMAVSIPVVVYFSLHPVSLGKGSYAEMITRFGFEPLLPAAVNPNIFVEQAVFVLIIAFLIGIYPLVYTSRLNVVAAIQK